MSELSKKPNDNAGYDERFRRFCVRLSEVLASAGVEIRPYRAVDLPVFSRQPVEKKKVAIEQIVNAVEVFEGAKAEGQQLKDSPALVWRALRKFGWTPSSDIFDKMHEGDIVQMYSKEQVAVFHNLSFYDWTSHTLEDLYSGLWYTLTKREEQSAVTLYGMTVEMLSGQRTETFMPGVGEHLCEEIDSHEMLKYWIEVLYISPVRTNGQIAGLIAVSRCRNYESA